LDGESEINYPRMKKTIAIYGANGFDIDDVMEFTDRQTQR
jgi:hypothetical protein